MKFGIIAAGHGSRLADEGVSLPKPLVRLGDRPMIGRLVDIMAANGAESIAVVVNPSMPEVARYLEDLGATLPVPLKVETRATPSSMHTFRVLGDMLAPEAGPRGRFIATTVDTVFHPDAFAAYARAFADAPGDIDGMMGVTSMVDDEKPLYVETDPDMRILAFRDTPWSEARYISAGIYGLDGNALGILDDCLAAGQSRMRNFQRALTAAGLDLRAYDLGEVADVDHASDIETARKILNIQL